MKKEIFLFTYIILCTSLSCKDFLKVDPPNTTVSSQLVFKSFSTANSAVAGIYSIMAQSGGGFASGSRSITALCGLSADELINYSTIDTEQAEFFNNKVRPANIKIQSIWAEFYKLIYSANAVIEGLNRSTGISESSKKKLEGEALFIRAFCHFYLVNLFDSVPIVRSTDYTTNRSISKSPNEQVYNSIISDLIKAQSQLDDNYIDNNRTRANKAVATALLARVYLYHKDWDKAEMASSELINNSSFTLEKVINDVFLIPSKESIWQIQSVLPQYNTFDGLDFILSGVPTNVSLRQVYAETMPSNDRRLNWIGQIKVNAVAYYYPFKYKVRFLAAGLPTTEYLVALRLSEQYLIRSEARTHLKKIEGAQNDLNMVRERAGLNKAIADDQPSMLLAIEQERKIELFAEWGHRWFDLKRTHRSDSVLPVVKPNWNAPAITFPIPELETNKNPKL